jgi:hypothetical protein
MEMTLSLSMSTICAIAPIEIANDHRASDHERKGGRKVTVADITLATFTLCNSLRVLAYLPQIAKAAADRSGAEALSFSMWGLFLLSNMSAVAYAVVNRADWTMAAMFLGNAVGCTTILLIGAWKRSQHRNRFVRQTA